MNKLQCPLCRQSFNDPCMCPHCSQVYCKKCIKKYLQDFYFCPSCDRHIIDLIDCSRLINQVREKIKESDLKKAKEAKERPVVPLQQCYQHSLPLKYHCLTCQIDICSDCGLISQKHKGHNIQPIQSIHPPKNIITQCQLKQIKHRVSQKLFTYQEQQKRYILQMQLLKSQIKYNKTKIYEYYEDLILRLQRETHTLVKEREERIHECTQQISEKQNIKEKIDELQRRHLRSMMKECYSPLVGHLSNSSDKHDQQGYDNHHNNSIEITDMQLYKYLSQKNYIKHNKSSRHINTKEQKHKRISDKTDNITKNVRSKSINNLQVNNRQQLSNNPSHKHQYPAHHNQPQTISLQHPSQQFPLPNSLLFDKTIYQLGIMKQIYPDYHNFSFQMDYLLSRHEDVLYSHVYKVYGYEWRLKIYPRGNAQAHNQHLSVFLQLINSPQALTTNTAKQYFFRLQLLNLNQAGKSVIKEYNSKFSVGQCWGYAEFVQINQVQHYLHDGKLLFVMGVKNVSYYDECDNMKKYIGKLQGQTKVLSELCSNYYLANNRSHNQSQQGNNQSQESNDANERSRIDLEGNELLGLNSSEQSLEQGILIGNGSRVSNIVENINMRLMNEDDISSIISSFDGD